MKYGIFKVCLLIFSLFSLKIEFYLFAGERPVSFEGEWFSDVTRQPKGFNARELYLFNTFNSKKFIFSQISFNETRKWEETRYSGKWDFEKGNLETVTLKPEGCSIYAADELGKRWVLIRAFDCDHLIFQAKILSEKEISISPSMDFDKPEKFQRAEVDPEFIQSLVISTDKKNFTSWGIRMNRVRKGSASYISKKSKKEKIPAQILETVDSSATHKTENSVEVGDILVVKNKKPSTMFD